MLDRALAVDVTRRLFAGVAVPALNVGFAPRRQQRPPAVARARSGNPHHHREQQSAQARSMRVSRNFSPQLADVLDVARKNWQY